MKNSFITILAGICLFSTGCKKKEVVDSDVANLTKSPWKLTALWVDPPYVNPFDSTVHHNIYPILSDCSKDDIMTFKVDNTLIFDEGPLNCDPANPQTTTSQWSFIRQDGKLLLTGGARIQGGAVHVSSLNDVEMTWRMEDMMFFDEIRMVTWQYGH